MARLARTPAEVVASEMSYATPETAWADALAIASVISNRALALGVTQQQVVGVQREFNAYNKRMPAGADIELAQQAIDDVAKFGPTTPATFYAMPKAVENLPATRQFDMAVPGGHKYFTEPTNGAIKTSVGFRAPVDIATVNSAAAQRRAYELAQAEEVGMPTPQARPDVLNITKNPALLAGAPLSQVDPNISTGVPAMSALTMPVDLAMAQSLQSIDPSAPINSPQALQAALSSLSSGITAQRDFMPDVDIAKGARPGQPTMADVDVAKGSRIGSVDMARFGEEVGPVANRVTTVSIPAQIDRPQTFSDASSVAALEQGMDAQRTTMPTIAGVKTDRAIASPQSRFAPQQGLPISQEDIARAFVNPTGLSQFDPSFTEGLMAGSNPVVPSAVPTASITPDMINSPEKLAAALSALSPETAPATDQSIAAAPAVNGFSALAAAGPIGAMNVTNLGVNSPEHQAMRERVNQQSIAAQQAFDDAKANGSLMTFDRTMIPEDAPANQAAQSNLAQGLMAVRSTIPAQATTADAALQAVEPTIEASLPSPSITSPSATMTPEQRSAYAQMAQSGFAAGLTNLAGLGRINAFGEYKSNVEQSPSEALTADVAAANPGPADRYDRLRTAAAKNPSRYSDLTPAALQDAMVETNNIPTPTENPFTAQPVSATPPAFDMINNPLQAAIDAAIANPAPALETVEVAPQPTIAKPVEAQQPAAITASTPSVTNSMPAVQARQPSAMSVWNGKATTGVATDGSTVSRLDNGRIGRYVPDFNHTVFSIDEGKTWSSPVAGNRLAPTTSSTRASVQPAVSGSLLGRLVSMLTGTTNPSVSPTDVGPSMGLDGGMSVARDGAAGVGAGWGAGGSASNPGSAGGYGSTNGVDPDKAY